VKDAAPGNPEVVDGYFALPSGPGLGVTLNEDVIEAHPATSIFFDLFSENWHLRQAEHGQAIDGSPAGRGGNAGSPPETQPPA
jgi:galactonate dehydratase